MWNQQIVENRIRQADENSLCCFKTQFYELTIASLWKFIFRDYFCQCVGPLFGRFVEPILKKYILTLTNLISSIYAILDLSQCHVQLADKWTNVESKN